MKDLWHGVHVHLTKMSNKAQQGKRRLQLCDVVPEELYLRWKGDRQPFNMSIVDSEAFERAKGMSLRDLKQQLGWIYVDCDLMPQPI